MSHWEGGFGCSLKPIPQSAKEARDMIAVAWAHWGLGDDDTARLVVSELVTNSITACRKAGRDDLTIDVRCGLTEDGPVIEVSDDADGSPRLGVPGPGDLNGRGLPLVASLSRRWTVETRPGGGKLVRVELEVAA